MFPAAVCVVWCTNYECGRVGEVKQYVFIIRLYYYYFIVFLLIYFDLDYIEIKT